MKILHVITSLRIGGAEKLLVDLLPRLQDMGNEVCLYAFSGEHTSLVDQLNASGIKVILGGKNDSVYHPKHIRILRQLMPKYDIVHTHNTSPQLFAALANIGKNTLLVTTEHNTSNRKRKLFFFHPIDKWMYKQYQQIICVSAPCFSNLKAYLCGESDRMCIISNGIDTQHFANAVPSSEYCHKSLHAAHIIINVAGFRWEKDQPTIIRAMHLLPDDYHLLLVGDGARKEEYLQMVHRLGIEARIHFLGVRSDVPELLKSADVVVMSSHHEGLSLSNLEGMAAGKPFVASDVDGLREIVSGYGVLFPHEDHNSLALEIKRLCEDTRYANNIASRCLQRAKEFDISSTVIGYSTIYRELINQKT